MYKLVAIDLDGTLLDDSKNIPQKNIDAIKKAKSEGVYVVLATGRPVEGIHQFLRQLDVANVKNYICAFNGALVCDEDKHIISKTFIKGSDLKSLYKVAKELNVNIHAFTENGCITPKMSQYTELEGSLNGIDVDIVDFDTIDDEMPIIKMMLVDPEEILEGIIRKIPRSFYDDYMVVRSAPFFLEFMNKECDKWIGIKDLSNYLNISTEEIICIGDAGNDLGMIKNAGLGVAMENAFRIVKKEAKHITGNNNDAGVSQVFDKFVFNRED